MRLIKIIPYFLSLIFATYTFIAEAHAVPLSSPRDAVETITKELLNAFQTNVSKYKKDRTLFLAEVDRLLTPVVAFDAIAKGVMSKYTRQAKPAQIDRFSVVFKDSLISFYGKALLTLDNTSLTIEKIDSVPDSVLSDYNAGKSRQISVGMLIKTTTRTVTISYSMVHLDGRWKLRNIIVDGINIGIQFRNQFFDAMDKYGDIQFVIEHWPEIMSGEKIAIKPAEGKAK